MPGKEADRSGLAEGLSQPEAGAGEERVVDVSELARNMEATRARLAHTKAAQEATIQRKIGERSILLTGIKDNVQALRAAREILAFYQSLEAKEELDEAANGEYEKVKTSVAELEQQVEAASKKSLDITREPEILDRLRKDSTKKRQERNLKTEFERDRAELNQRVELIAGEVNALASELYDVNKRIETQEGKTDTAWAKINRLLEEAERQGKDLYWMNSFVSEEKHKPTGLKFKEKLVKKRADLGVWKYRADRKALRGVLVPANDQFFLAYDEQVTELANLKSEKQAVATKVEELGGRFLKLITEAWEMAAKLEAQGYKPGNYALQAHNLPGQTYERLGKIVTRKYAGMAYTIPHENEDGSRNPDGGKKVGKYADWSIGEAREPKNRELLQIWQQVERAAEHIKYSRPKELLSPD